MSLPSLEPVFELVCGSLFSSVLGRFDQNIDIGFFDVFFSILASGNEFAGGLYVNP